MILKKLFVWFIPDPYNNYPLSPEVICDKCPKPDNIFKDIKTKYDPDFHDYVLGLKDYYVSLSYYHNEPEDVKGLCFECDRKINMSKGYGFCYIPDKYCTNTTCSVVYCQNCYRERCKNHVSFDQESESEKIELRSEYWEVTDNGKL